MDYLNFELFPPLDFVDYSIGMTSKSTRKKRSPSAKNAIALQTPKTLTIKD